MPDTERNTLLERYVVAITGEGDSPSPGLVTVRDCIPASPFQLLLLGKSPSEWDAWKKACVASGGTAIALPDAGIPHAWRFFPLELQRALLLRRYLADKTPALVVAPCRGASLFFCLQARETLGEHAGCRFLTVMNAPYEYELHRSGAWNLRGVEGTKAMWAERCCVEQCDAIVAEDDAALEWAKDKGWRVPQFSIPEANGTRWPKAPVPRAPSVPLISICVAHYNHGVYLPAALNSLAAQTWPNLEILVFDDGSSETSSQNVFAWCKNRYDGRFRFFEGENKGPSVARNRCAAQARGEFLLFFDADNLATPEMTTTLYAALERSRAALALSHFAAFRREDGRGPVPDYRWGPLGADLATALQQNCMGDVTFLIRRELFLALRGFPPTPYGCEDWAFLVRAVLSGHRMTVVPEPLYWYRHTDNGMRSTMPLRNSHEQVLREYAAILPEYALNAVRYLLLPPVYESVAGMTPIVSWLYRLGLWLDHTFITLFPAGTRRRRFFSWLRCPQYPPKAKYPQ